MEVIKINNGFRGSYNLFITPGEKSTWVHLCSRMRCGSYNLFITPGEKVEIHTHHANGELVDVRVFRPGDVAEYDSFNLSYTAKITGITAKNVIFDVSYNHDKPVVKRLKMENFAWRNHNFDVEATRKRNAITSMSI